MTTAGPQKRPSQRFYDLDALRALAMFLGIVLHSTLFVLPEQVSQWPLHVADAEGDPTYRIVIDFIHGFRMPLFFLISGFFSALLWQRRSLNALGMQRLKRIGLPLVGACLTILPLSIGLLAVIADYKDPYDFSLWLLPLAWVVSLGHLWFLWYLLIITAGFIAVIRYGSKFLHPMMWWLLIPVSALSTLIMVEPLFGPDTAEGFIPGINDLGELALLAHYSCFFLMGVFIYQREIAVRKWWSVALLPAIAAFVIGYLMIEQFIEDFGLGRTDLPEAYLFEHHLTWIAGLIEVGFAWLMCFGMMGVFRWIAARESYTSRYLSDSTYWMYLVHVPIVIAGQWLMLDWPISYHLKFVLLVVGVTALVLVTYEYVVRYTIIGRTLNGPRTRRPPKEPDTGAGAPRDAATPP